MADQRPPYHNKFFGLKKGSGIKGVVAGVDYTGMTRIFNEGFNPSMFPPMCEIQKSNYCDFYDCISEGHVNMVRIWYEMQGIIKKWSVRFLAKISGTTRQGNVVASVTNALNKYGLPEEADWPRDPSMDWNAYYSAITRYVIQLAAKLMYGFKPYPIPPIPEAISEAKFYGFIGYTGAAWYQGPDGLYHDYGYEADHFFIGRWESPEGNWDIWDSYPADFIIDQNSDKQEFEKTCARDFKFGSVTLFVPYNRLQPAINVFDYIIKFIKFMVTQLKGVIWFFPDMGGDGTMWMTKKNKDGSLSRKKLETIGDIMSILDQNFGVKKVGYGELSQYKEVEKFQ